MVRFRSAGVPITLTKTLHSRRSPETSTPVTVTSPCTRVSRSPLARSALTSARISSDTLSSRWLISVGNELHLLIEKLGELDALDEVEHLVDDRVHEGPFVADDREAQRRPLPEVEVIDLGDRHVELLLRAPDDP